MIRRRVAIGIAAAAVALVACDDGGVETTGTGAGGATAASSTSSSTTTTTTTTATTSATATTTNSTSTGEGGCSGGNPDPQGTPIADPDDPCATLMAMGEPDERVSFVEKGEDSTFSNMIEVMWAWRYAVRVPAGTEASYEVEQERCSKPAGEAETCDTLVLAPLTKECTGPVFGPKFAVDPSQYNPGENQYRITMRLRRGCEIRSEDSFTMKLTYNP